MGPGHDSGRACSPGVGASNLGQEYRELADALWPGNARWLCLTWPLFTILLSFVAMYAALGPWLATHFRLDHARECPPGPPSGAARHGPGPRWPAGWPGASVPPGSPSPASVLAAAGLVLEAVTAGTLVAAGRCQRHLRGRHRDRGPAMIALVGSRGGPGAWRGARARRACRCSRRSLLRPARSPASDQLFRTYARSCHAADDRGRSFRSQQSTAG